MENKRRARRLSLARWHGHVNAVQAPAWLRPWLTHRASLTARLKAHSQQFRVQRLSQDSQICLQDEAAVIGLSRVLQVHEREVILRCDGVPVVYGHTIVPLNATATEWPLFAALGERSLGTTLFNDPQVRREQLFYARIAQDHPLWQRIRHTLPDLTLPPRLYARRSIFRRKGGCLLVTEVFLPQMAELRRCVMESSSL
jgi:chorismate--pyruvate lyase